jgi:nuclear receptor subfamily 1 group D protein 3
MGKGNKLLLLFAGFCDLSQDDQLILIKVGFFEIWLGHVARLISDSSLTFADGTYITRQQMDLMYDVRHHISNKLY